MVDGLSTVSMTILLLLEPHILNKSLRNEVDIRIAEVKYDNPASVLTVCSNSVAVMAEKSI
jgi:hypothetical protein